MKTLLYVTLLIVGLAFILAACSDNSTSPVASVDQAELLKAQTPSGNGIVTQFTMTGMPMYGPYTYPDGKGSMKGAQGDGHVDATDQRVTGMMHVVNNAPGNDHEHGTFTLTPDAGGGVWEGTWQGQVKYYTPPIGRPYSIREWKMAGGGKGGAIDGLQLSITATSPNGMPPNATGTITSR